jgi:hypothetical protein
MPRTRAKNGRRAAQRRPVKKTRGEQSAHIPILSLDTYKKTPKNVQKLTPLQKNKLAAMTFYTTFPSSPQPFSVTPRQRLHACARRLLFLFARAHIGKRPSLWLFFRM